VSGQAASSVGVSLLVTQLEPFTNYSFTVSVCNSQGCVNSSQSTASTLMSGTIHIYSHLQ